jgi:hypothetical protein
LGKWVIGGFDRGNLKTDRGGLIEEHFPIKVSLSGDSDLPQEQKFTSKGNKCPPWYVDSVIP